jgi:magnesium transporter
MTRFLRKSSEKSGQTPGTAVYVGASKSHDVALERFLFDADDLTHEIDVSPAAAGPQAGAVLWLNVDGVHNVPVIEQLGESFGLHPLAVEDIVHTGQRPKVDEYPHHVFLVLRMLRWNDDLDEIDDEQVSLAIGDGWVVSFQERVGDVFDPIRTRLSSNRGRVRRMGADYLAYVLVDAIVDHYFVVLETLGERIEALGESIADDVDGETMTSIRRLKKELLFMRKSVWPLREVISSLQRDHGDWIGKSTLPYLRDLYDHTIQIIDTVETYRDMVSGLMDLHMSTMSQRMNEVMKVLTIIATIFIPLSFVAGVYGMNFRYMPELMWRYGYFGALGLMLAIAVGMLVYFKRKKWL